MFKVHNIVLASVLVAGEAYSNSIESMYICTVRRIGGGVCRCTYTDSVDVSKPSFCADPRFSALMLLTSGLSLKFVFGTIFPFRRIVCARAGGQQVSVSIQMIKFCCVIHYTRAQLPANAGEQQTEMAAQRRSFFNYRKQTGRISCLLVRCT